MYAFSSSHCFFPKSQMWVYPFNTFFLIRIKDGCGYSSTFLTWRLALPTRLWIAAVLILWKRSMLRSLAHFDIHSRVLTSASLNVFFIDKFDSWRGQGHQDLQITFCRQLEDTYNLLRGIFSPSSFCNKLKRLTLNWILGYWVDSYS